jgi:hypothetical protein
MGKAFLLFTLFVDVERGYLLGWRQVKRLWGLDYC